MTISYTILLNIITNEAPYSTNSVQIKKADVLYCPSTFLRFQYEITISKSFLRYPASYLHHKPDHAQFLRSGYLQSLLENGEEFTNKFVARPGHSEHQTGLAIDLGLKQPDIDFLRPNFPYEGICQTFRELAADYGFIERYPVGKEAITGIAHEPWHFRYVGVPHAKIMVDHNWTLEEYHLHLSPFFREVTM